MKLDKDNLCAVIGASNNKEKYGYKVLKDLKESGYKVVPINLHEDKVLGLETYKSILDVNSKIKMVIFVVPPKATEKILRDVKKLKIKKVWMQPGSESDQAIRYCEENNIECIHNICMIIKNHDNLLN